MTHEWWNERAIKFLLGQSVRYTYADGQGREVFIEQRQQIDDSIKWIVCMDKFCLGKDNKYHYEPMPSSRTEEFISNTRFDSKEDAFAAFMAHEKTVKDVRLYVE